MCLHTRYIQAKIPPCPAADYRLVPLRNSFSRGLTTWFWVSVVDVGAFVKVSGSKAKCQSGSHRNQNCCHVRAVIEHLQLPIGVEDSIPPAGDDDFSPFGEAFGEIGDEEVEQPEGGTTSSNLPGYPYPLHNNPEYQRVVFDKTLNPPKRLRPPLPIAMCHCGCSYVEEGYQRIRDDCMVYHSFPTCSYEAEIFFLNCPRQNPACRVAYDGYEDALFRFTDKSVFGVRYVTVLCNRF